MYMGRVIGQKGVTINDLQKRSGCDIQINQNVPVGMDCEINIKGSRQGIEMAKQMIQEIIELGPNHSYAGGRKFIGVMAKTVVFIVYCTN
jgi:rRNA processing protein Krr1/Pno1